MAQQGVPYLIPLGGTGMVAHVNRWNAAPGELLLAENVVVENDLLQKEPATVYYDPAGTESNDLIGANPSGATLAAMIGLSTSPFYSTFDGVVAGSTTPGTSWVLAIPTATFVESVYVVGVTREAGTGGVIALTDSKGNTYTRVVQTTGSGMQLEIWVGRHLTALATSDTLTVTLADGTADVNLVARSYTSILSLTPVDSGTVTDAGGSFFIPSIHTPHFPVVWIGIVADTAAASTMTFGNGWELNGSLQTSLGAHTTFHLWIADPGYNGIQGQIEWSSGAENIPAGTILVRLDQRTVAGSGTAFLTVFRPGDEIIAAGETHRIDTITSDTLLTVLTPWTKDGSGLAYTRRAGPVLITYTTSNGGSGIIGTIWKERPANGIFTNHGTLIDDRIDHINMVPHPPSIKFVAGGKESALLDRKLFLLNGVDPIQVLSGDASVLHTIGATSGGASPDWGTVTNPSKQPISGIVHQDSLMAFGNLNDPHRLYISNPSDHEDFTAAGGAITLRIASQIGERLYAAATYQGVLFLFKYPRGVFYLDDTAVDRFQWGYRIRSAMVGCAPSPHAVLSIDDDVVFCDPNGHFHLLSAVDTLGGTKDSDLTQALGLAQWTHDHVATTYLNQLVSVFDPRTKTAWFGMRSTEAVTATVAQNDLLVRIQFSASGPRVTTSRVWFPASLTLKRRDFLGEQAVLIGETANSWLVRPQEYGTRVNRNALTDSDVTIGLPSQVTLPQFTMRDEHRNVRKQFVACEGIFQDAASATQGVEVALTVDGQLRQTFPLRANGGLVRRQVTWTLNAGSGYTASADVTTDGTVATDCGLVGLVLYYQPTDTDESRRS